MAGLSCLDGEARDARLAQSSASPGRSLEMWGPLAEPVSASPISRSAGSGGRSECEHQPQSRLDGLHHLGRQRADSLAEEALIDGIQL